MLVCSFIVSLGDGMVGWKDGWMDRRLNLTRGDCTYKGRKRLRDRLNFDANLFTHDPLADLAVVLVVAVFCANSPSSSSLASSPSSPRLLDLDPPSPSTLPRCCCLRCFLCSTPLSNTPKNAIKNPNGSTAATKIVVRDVHPIGPVANAYIPAPTNPAAPVPLPQAARAKGP